MESIREYTYKFTAMKQRSILVNTKNTHPVNLLYIYSEG